MYYFDFSNGYNFAKIILNGLEVFMYIWMDADDMLGPSWVPLTITRQARFKCVGQLFIYQGSHIP